jgi:glycosyltransferase involved in cell wall biosynthesis
MELLSMRIVHLIPNLDKGGAERICLDICEELQNSGHNVKIFIFENVNKYIDVYPNLDIECVPVQYQLSLIKRDKIDIKLLQKKVNEFAPDVIHSHLYYANIIGFELKPKNHIIHVHSNIPSLKKLPITSLLNLSKVGLYYEQRKIYRAIKNSNVTFLTIAKESFNYITKNISDLKPKIVLEHNAINLNRFKTAETSSTSRERFNIISIARLIDYKGHDLTIEIAKCLKELKFEFFISIFGEGTERNYLQSLIDEKELNKHVKLKGLTNHPEKVLVSSDLYFHSTKYEPFGLVLIEAMASGIPVITTDGQGNRDIIKDRINGLFFFNRNPAEIANAIIEVKQNKVLRDKLIANGKQYAEGFGIIPYCRKLEQLYKI